MAIALCLVCMAGRAQFGIQFENRGFEEWANFGNTANTIEPLHWHSTMSADGSFTGFLSQQMEPSSITRPGSTGAKSARIWANSILGIVANGNMTNGRMHAGSMTPSGSNNYVYTQRADSRFNTPISVVPDSLTAWVCFRCSNPYQTAQLRSAIHGDADLKAMANSTFDPDNKVVATATANFTRTSEAGVDYQWRRISMPFNANGPCDDPRYILFSVTTNNVPGEGAISDELFLDDVLLVYRPSIEIDPIVQDHFQLGESFSITFRLQGTMSPENLGGAPNQVIAQLSSSNGSFSNPTDLGRITTNVSGSLNVQIPGSMLPGEHYRIRLVTTNYPMISQDNGTDLSIQSNVEIGETPMENELVTMEIFDLTGRKVGMLSTTSGVLDSSVLHLVPGLYVAKYQKNNQQVVQKFLAQ